MADTSRIREHMEIVGADGGHVGVVDKVEPGRGIKLASPDEPARGEHHYVPLAWVREVGEQVRLDRPAAEARREWQVQPPHRAANEIGA